MLDTQSFELGHVRISRQPFNSGSALLLINLLDAIETKFRDLLSFIEPLEFFVRMFLVVVIDYYMLKVMAW